MSKYLVQTKCKTVVPNGPVLDDVDAWRDDATEDNANDAAAAVEKLLALGIAPSDIRVVRDPVTPRMRVDIGFETQVQGFQEPRAKAARTSPPRRKSKARSTGKEPRSTRAKAVRSASNPYTPSERAEVLAYARSHSAAAAMAHYGVGRSTYYKWLKESKHRGRNAVTVRPPVRMTNGAGAQA